MPPIYLSPDEASGLLRVSRDTILREIGRGKYPGVIQAGRQYRIPATDLGVSDDDARAYVASMETREAA